MNAVYFLKRAVKKMFSILGFDIVRKSELEMLRSAPPFTLLYGRLSLKKQMAISPYLPFSMSQQAQDLFVLSELHDCESAKFFVEFGATDGVSLSNSHLLETKLGWDGILAEPATTWHERLATSRKCKIDHRCVSGATGESVDFLEVLIDEKARASPELSGMREFADTGDWASKIRLSHSRTYRVETVSLGDLLEFHNAPYEIGYLSLDTEGSELSTLSNYDFASHQIRVITVEHNYRKDTREAILQLLTAAGYERKYPEISQWDDWYVLKSL